MSFRIRPFEKILTPGESHCCVDGKTPTEFSSAPASAFPETVLDNGDGTFTTTWVMDGNQTSLFEIHFIICCKNTLSLSVTAQSGGPLPPFTEVYYGQDGGNGGGTLIYSAENSFSDIQIDEKLPAAPFYPVGACGLHVTISGTDIDQVGDTISITI